MIALLRRRWQLGFLGLVVVAAITVIGVAVLPSSTAAVQTLHYQHPPRTTGADWAGYLADGVNSSYNAQEHLLDATQIPQVRPIGMFNVGKNIPSKDAIGTTVISVGNTLYFGSWDGYEYACLLYTSPSPRDS